MTPRERFNRTMHFQPVDHVPDEEFGWWSETLPLWHEQGLPKEIDTLPKGDFFFGFEVKDGVPTHQGLIPSFKEEVIEENDEHIVYTDGTGVTFMQNKARMGTIPKYLKFPIETRADWEDFRKRLDPTLPERHKWNVDEVAEKLNKSENAVVLGTGSLFGWIRNWMGFENAAMGTLDAPEWIEEMVDHLADFLIGTFEMWLGKVQIDVAHFWEDICFNNGPMISPTFFKEVVTPRYKRITDRLKEHGTDVVYVDCDGNIMELVPHWLAGGVNVMFPIEIRGNSDPLKMRELYGHDVLLAGGVDKMALIAGKEAIIEDLKRLDPLVQDGGFIPHVDHRVPPDVTYENYLYYLKEKRAWLGIPEPAPYEERLAELEKTDPERAAEFKPKK